MQYLKYIRFVLILLLRIKRKVILSVKSRFWTFYTHLLFISNDIDYTTIRSLGIPIVQISRSGKCFINEKFVIVNNATIGTLGRCNRSKILVYPDATLRIGKNVGISNTTIVATDSIVFGDNIIIGGGCTIVDSDFHSLNPIHWHTSADELYMKSSPVIIKDNVFIGMDCIILKGVTIGNNVIIAAGSVISKDIPNNEIWGGNPAVFIKNNVSK